MSAAPAVKQRERDGDQRKTLWRQCRSDMWWRRKREHCLFLFGRSRKSISGGMASFLAVYWPHLLLSLCLPAGYWIKDWRLGRKQQDLFCTALINPSEHLRIRLQASFLSAFEKSSFHLNSWPESYFTPFWNIAVNRWPRSDNIAQGWGLFMPCFADINECLQHMSDVNREMFQ